MKPGQKITRVRVNQTGNNALLVSFFFISFLPSFVILKRTYILNWILFKNEYAQSQ